MTDQNDEPTETLQDNMVEAEWTDDDEIALPATAPLSEAEQLLAVLHRLTNAGHVVEFHGSPRQVVVTRRGEQGDTLSIHEHARGRTFIESLHVASARVERYEFDALKTRCRRESRFWPVLQIGGDRIDVEIWERPPTSSVKGWLYGPGFDLYGEACEWLQKKIVAWEARIHDDCPTADQLRQRTSAASDARQKTYGMQAAWDQIAKDEAEWRKQGGF